MSYDKHIVDGQVAVLVSPGFGAGWQTWAHAGEPGQLCMDKRLVDAFMVGGHEALEPVVREIFGSAYVYFGGASGLEVQWVPVGQAFQIHEYDGSETIELRDSMDWYIA